MKKIVSLLLTFSMLFSYVAIIPVAAADETFSYTHESIPADAEWSAFSSAYGNNFTAPDEPYYIYLPQDWSTSNTISVQSGATVYLCLNDHTLTNTDSKTAIRVYSGGTLYLYDTDGGTTRSYDDPTDLTGTATFPLTGGAITGGVGNIENDGGGIYIDGGTVNMYGGNIVGNSTPTGTTTGLGGGVYMDAGSTFNMYGGYISGNTSYGHAGGVYVQSGANFTMEGGTISHNYTNISTYQSYAGGVYVAGTFTMNGGEICYNNPYCGGGAVSVIGTFYLNDGSIHHNTTQNGAGGGVFLGSGAKFYMTGGDITHNVSPASAGGVNVNNATAAMYMSGGTIAYNEATGYGGGVVTMNTSTSLSLSGDAQIINNTAGYGGGGIFMNNGAVSVSDSVTVTGNVMGGEIICTGDGTHSLSGGTTSNAYVQSGLTITIAGELSGTIGVTYADGTGTVSQGTSAYTATVDDKTKFVSDDDSLYVIKGDNTVKLAAATTSQGTDESVTYSHDDIDVSALGMFTQTDDTTSYTITPVTGDGTVDGEVLSDYTVGTYLVTAETPYSDTSAPSTKTATLTVTQRDVTITGLVAVDRGVSASDRTVELTGGILDGVLAGDEVEIDLSIAYGYINSSDYATAGTYPITINGVAITGDDAHNYNLTSAIGDTTVTLSVNIPYISWPDAQDIVYGETRSNSDLLGGKVVVKTTEGDYVTITGEFQWVGDDLTAEPAIGEYSYTVKFVPDAVYSEYADELEDMTRTIAQIVRAAEVEFDITNYVYEVGSNTTPSYTTIVEGVETDLIYGTVTVSTWALANGADYAIVYSNGGWTNEVPTDAGTYAIATVLNPDKYVVIGSLDTIKQIGMLYIYDNDSVDEPTAYSVTYGNIDTETVYPGEILVLPTVDGDYSGWSYTYSGVTTYYDFSARFTMPAYDVTFDLVASPTADKTISGVVKGTDLDGAITDPLDGIGVQLVQGGDVLATTTTDEDGKYSFTVAADRYNLVFTRDQGIKNEETVFVDVTSSNATVDVNLPDTMQNTVLYIASGMTAITVEGLKDYDDTDSIRLSITTSPTAANDNIFAEAAKYGLTNENVKLIYDVTIEHLTSSGYEVIDSIKDDLTIYIPIAGLYQGKIDYTVFTDIGGETNSYAATMDEGGTLLTLTLNETGIYALSFRDTEATVLAGATDATTTYAADAYDLSQLFTFSDTDADADIAVYSVTSEDGGVATVDENGGLVVDKIGTFTVTINIPATTDTPAYTGTATLEVTAKTVTITQINTLDQTPDEDNYDVTLTGSGLMTGLVTGDDVKIDFEDASGTINSLDYWDDDNLTNDGYNTFGVTVIDLDIEGEDAGNYNLYSNTVTTSVYVYKDIPYFSWPSAINITVGETPTNDDLYGGKVMVRDPEGGYTLLDGHFEWVKTPSTSIAIGTLGSAVKFVEDDADTSSSYYAEVSTTTQTVSQTVMAASVKFNITNNVVTTSDIDTLTITPEVMDSDIAITADHYTISYFYKLDDGSYSTATTERPTTAGTYFISAEFTNPNFIHSGTLVSTGKQIGAFYIYEDVDDAPTSYSVTFDGYESFYISTAYPQEIHVLPTIEGDDYIGWYYEPTDASYGFGERFPMPEANVTLTAIAAPTNYTISGTIIGTDLDNTPGTALYKVGVVIMQGSEVIDYGETDLNGEYSFDVPAGLYHIVVTRDQIDLYNIETVYVDARTSNQVVDFVLPDIRQNAIIEIAAGITDVAVEGLTALVQSEAGVENTITLSIQQYVYDSSADTEDEQVAIQNAAYSYNLDNDDLKYFLDISLTEEKVEGVKTALTETSEMLTFYIPLTGTLQGCDHYEVYRYHDGEVDKLTTTPNDDGEFIELDGTTTLIIHAQKFSTLGIAAFDNVTITFGCETGGSITETSMTVPEGTAISSITMPTVTVSDHYVFDGWYQGTTKIDTNSDTYIFESDVTLTAKFTTSEYSITSITANGATVSGVTVNEGVSYNSPISFTVTQPTSGIISSVGYSVAGGNADVTTITPDNTGTYTIPGDQVIGNVSITVYVTNYVTITFADNHTSGAAATAYAVSGANGLYASTDAIASGTPNFTIPTPVADSGYRLADVLWGYGSGQTTTSNNIQQTMTFTADITFTAQTVKTYTVTFTSGENGSISGGDSITVDIGTAVSSISMPTTTANAGYEFTGWTQSPDGDTITEDTEFTANFDVASYDFLYNFNYIEVISGASEDGEATHGTNIVFKNVVNEEIYISAVWYQIGDAAPVQLAVTDSTYTIPGSDITASVSIWVVSANIYTVTFDFSSSRAESGTIEIINVVHGGQIGASDVPAATAKAGYVFKHWTVDDHETDPDGYEVVSNVTFTAVYAKGTYYVTASTGDQADNIEDIAFPATYGDNLVFTPTVTGKIVTGVTATVNDTPVTVSESNGVYTIDGDVIIGEVEITLAVISGTFDFIYDSDYKALKSDTKIAVLSTAKLGSGVYQIDGVDMFYSSKYGGAYLLIVDENETATSISAKLSLNESGSAIELVYSGDINGDGSINVIDAGRINAFLHDLTDADAMQERLQADLNGTKTASTFDIAIIIDEILGN